MAQMPTGKPKEQEIQKAILQYLRVRRIPCWRFNVIGIPMGDGKMRPNPEMKGVADIHLIIKRNGVGVSSWLEVKRPGMKQTENQIEFQEAIEKAGGLYRVVHSVEEVIEFLKEFHETQMSPKNA